MSCEHCDGKDRYLLSQEVLPIPVFSMLGESKISGNEALEHEEPVFVFIDRGYLRLVGTDSQCLDHGEKIKINFCPVCGEWLTNPNKK